MLCKTCLQQKEADAFYVCNKSRCKECIKKAVRDNRLQNIEHYRAFDKARASMPHRVAARREYARTPQGKAAHQRALKASDMRYPERKYARAALRYAVKKGRVVPWPVCAVPDCDSKPEAHHPDYSRPLDVVWLCPLHHKQVHTYVANESAMKERA